MTILLLLLLLGIAVAVAEWRGWVPDTRTGTDWLPRDEARHRQLHV